MSAEELRVYDEEPEREAVMQIVNEFEARGIEEGIRKGGAAVVLRQLRRRFAKLPSDLEAGISELPASKLEELAESLLDFATIDDARGWLIANT